MKQSELAWGNAKYKGRCGSIKVSGFMYALSRCIAGLEDQCSGIDKRHYSMDKLQLKKERMRSGLFHHVIIVTHPNCGHILLHGEWTPIHHGCINCYWDTGKD